MKLLVWDQLDPAGRRQALSRPQSRQRDLQADVAAIIARVRREGDQALLDYTRRFDQSEPASFPVTEDLIGSAAVPSGLAQALKDAKQRIEAFHRPGIPRAYQVRTAPGVICETRYQPLSPVGLYVPGGSAPLISTVLMLGVPARLAGCKDIVLCTPPDSEGRVPDAILVAARLCGIDTIFPVGGAQAVAAMAYGTGTIPACRKIFGPGNAWVTEAKRQVAQDPAGAAMDLPAGPSEVMVIADRDADPESLAWDLLSQAEHGPDSLALLITDNRALAVKVRSRVDALARTLPRAAILQDSIANMLALIVANAAEAVDIANDWAPEHLLLNCANARALSEKISTAGSIFIGPWTPESLGDYCSGTNHVLPTFGHAAAHGSLAVADFMRRYTCQTANPEGLAAIGPCASTLARTEGLEAHRMAVAYRLTQLEAASCSR